MTHPPRQEDGLLGCSLVSLRAFREVARRKSFTAAAAYLAVTQSAVSHHIKLLESELNVKLLRRYNKQYELTDEGRTLFQAVDAAFSNVETAIRGINQHINNNRLVLGGLASFVSKWLMPRLGDFYKTHPQIELVVRSVNHTIDVLNERVDLGILHSATPPASPLITSELLWSEELFAVCSPAYLARRPITTLADLRTHVLLHDETEIAAERHYDWQAWLAALGQEQLLAETTSHYFSQSDLTIKAATAGYGIALARTSLVADDLKDGRLVNPLPQAVVKTDSGCYMCALASAWEADKIKMLRQWLQQQVGGSGTGKKQTSAKGGAG